MAVKKRCFFCHKHTRPDGTCQTEGCPLYVPEEKVNDDTNTPKETTEESATDTNAGGQE